MQVNIILSLPLFSFITCGLIGYFNNKKLNSVVDALSISFLFTAFLFSISIFLNEETFDIKMFEFISFRDEVHTVKDKRLVGAWLVHGLKFNIGFFVDNLTKLMFVVVTSVSTVVHIYSAQYMKKDENKQRFMSYLSLFTFCMLALVSAPNFIQLFIGWEGVGVCSYFLIGFWYKKDSAASAANKAFIVNRISDFAVVIGMLMILKQNESLNFSDIKSIEALSAMLLFVGCMGKSAQLFFHVWLPDAMEGPTPVSALIHAATMVTAGVFLLARCNIGQYPIISIIGAATAFFAATTALAQRDIKKIIAYSTCSQLGYMFMASGSGAHQNAMFHIVNHAFFKAMLFLCAGNVIHALHEQDIFKISKISSSINGGLASKMKITYLFFAIGSLAITGIPPLSGYYSKDAILESVRLMPQIGETLYFIGVFVAFLTSIYSVKILYFVFYKNKAYKAEDRMKGTMNSIKDSKIKSFILSILAFGSIFSGIYGFYFLNITKPNYYLRSANEFNYAPYHDNLPMIAGILGILCGYVIYRYKINKLLAKRLNAIYNLLQNKYYFDEIYNLTLVFMVRQISKTYYFIDKLIDKIFIGGLSNKVYWFGKIVRKMNTGYINSYLSFSLIFITLVSFYASYVTIVS